jgi:hypothetical protein
MQSDVKLVAVDEVASFAIHPEGQDVEIGFLAPESRRCILKLHPHTLGVLFALIPSMLDQALQRLGGGQNARQVFELAGWSVEATPSDGRVLITLTGHNGFHVTFVAPEPATDRLAVDLAAARDSDAPSLVTSRH